MKTYRACAMNQGTYSPWQFGEKIWRTRNEKRVFTRCR